MAVPKLDFVLLFVANPAKSAEFYGKMLGLKPVEQSPTFALFALEGVMLGLWLRDTAEPKVTAHAGASEIAFCEDDVDAVYSKWIGMDVPILQVPTDLDFGRSFVALDPDGHRIRVMKLNGE